MSAPASPSADISLMADGDSKIDAKERTGDPPSEAQATCVQTTHGHLPAGDTLDAGKVDETVAVPIQIIVLPTHKPEKSSEYSDGLEQPQKMADASAEDPIAALRRQLVEQQVVNASLRSQLFELEEHRSAQLLWNASLAERVGKLEPSGKAVAETDIVISLSPDARDATEDEPEALAEINPDAAVDGADTAKDEDTCELEESMWDSALFLFRRDVGMGRVVTLWAVLALLLNILVQATIAVIVFRNMGDPTFVARVIEDLWYASEPGLASECHVARPGWVIIYTTGCGGRCARWLDRRSSVGFS
jgi:hypothetical protein